EVRCFSLPVNAQEDRWITAIDFQPGNGAVVYSASFFIENPGRNKKDGDCDLKSGTVNHESLGVWIPGQVAERLPAGAGRLLPANARILMRIHYRKNGEDTTDRSRLGLYFAKDRVEKIAHTITIGPDGANAANGRMRVTHTLTAAAEAIAIRPLLFPYAESLEARAYHPDGSIEVLIWARSYRYDWQPSYYFRRPPALPKGTRIEVTAYLKGAEARKLPEAFCEIILTAISERTSQHRPAPAPAPHRVPHPAPHHV
ncbi:MAG: hypothetical protein J2P41_23810, partial [Blastocatellia bacterium]|nr:hypothetical protein [Blastocatellia bacterium]